MTTRQDGIEIRGADANNLKKVDVNIPRNALTAVVGVSGSGKSSLVEDSIAVVAAERMRRFLHIEQPALQGSHVDAYIGACPPMLFAGQRAFRASARTTLGTSTGLLRLLRRLFVKFGAPFADDAGEMVPEPSSAIFATWLKTYTSGKATVWASPVVNQQTDGVAAVERLRKAGVDEAVIHSETDRGAKAEGGTLVSLAKFRPLRADVRHSIEARIADFDLRKTSPKQLEEALSKAWASSPMGAFIALHDERRPELRRAYAFGLDARVHRVHPKSAVVYRKPDPHLLTFNAPKQLDSGACPACDGLGVSIGLDERALVVHPERSMRQGALALWTEKNYRYVNVQHATIEGLRGRDGFDPDIPWRKLSPSARRLVLDGTPERVQGMDPVTKKKRGAPVIFEGFRKAVVERATRNSSATKALAAFVGSGPCPTCGGTRWSTQARALRVAGQSVDRLLALPLADLETEALRGALAKDCPPEARPIVANIARMAASMIAVGLGHLSGDRGMLDVSDGESRRTRLAGVLTSRLTGLLLVLDEPARGLHEQDLVSLGDALLSATEHHTVIVSEHRQRIIGRADHLIELGPGAGPQGGVVTRDGPLEGTSWQKLDHLDIESSPNPACAKWIEIEGVDIHNLHDVSVRIPVGAVSCIAGVSGSGKSSFVRGALVPALMAALPEDCVEVEDFRTRRGSWKRVRGVEGIKALYALDQAPVTAHQRSLVATFLDVAEGIRTAYAAQSEAKRLGLVAPDFSTNAGKGRCPRCLGIGRLHDGEECPVCGGLSFGADVLAVRVCDLSYLDLLRTPIGDLLGRADAAPVDRELLRSISELGVGHLALGRSLDTLSGGEVQRLRIARALARHKVRGGLFLLDEPAGGLHPQDVGRLSRALRHIVQSGNTVVLVEHDLHLLATCDHIVEFGPGSGPAGGRIIAEGPPAKVRKGKTPTGLALNGLPRHRGHEHAAVGNRSPDLVITDASRARAELRQILGDDVQTPGDEDALLAPAAMAPTEAAARRALEIGDLDAAVVSILLDAVRTETDEQLEHAARNWDTRSTRLLIHPLLDALATWGTRVPQSVMKEAEQHGSAMGIEWLQGTERDPRGVRAWGPRFEARRGSLREKRHALRDALAVGGGYVEFVDARGSVRRTVCARLMDLDAGQVGPRHAIPGHFRRLDPRGACPMCRGKSRVAEPDRNFIVSRTSGCVLDDQALDRRAAAILKGVWRSDVTPFFRRLEEEGLWDADARWSDLDEESDGTVMHGFWVRPGNGTFLKKGPKFDGSEVNHWLRWDGLVSALDGQLERSSDAGWREALLESMREVICPMCRGAGVGPAASLLRLAGKTLDEWTRHGHLGPFLEALEALKGLPPRAVQERTRVMYCLAPLRADNPALGHPVEGPAARESFARTAEAFSGLQVAAE